MSLSVLSDMNFAKDKETLSLWSDAGLKTIFFGAETGSNKILNFMEKPATVERNLRQVQAFNEQGIAIHTHLLVGFPGENEETIRETLSFMSYGLL